VPSRCDDDESRPAGAGFVGCEIVERYRQPATINHTIRANPSQFGSYHRSGIIQKPERTRVMVKDLRRVRIRTEKDFRALLDELRRDHTPRLIEEEDGQPLAVLMDPDDYAEMTHIPKSRLNKDRIRSLIGSWDDLDADKLIADIYRWRDEAPPSPDPARFIDDPDETNR
jgi:hypothetical protein